MAAVINKMHTDGTPHECERRDGSEVSPSQETPNVACKLLAASRETWNGSSPSAFRRTMFLPMP